MSDTSRFEELRRRVQQDPASTAFAALAEEYRRLGRLDEAIATSRAGLDRHPAYLSAQVTLGRALLESGRHAEARQELEHVLRVAPENLAAIRALAEIHHHSRMTDSQAAGAEPPAADGERHASEADATLRTAPPAEAPNPLLSRLEAWLDAIRAARARRAGLTH